MDELRIVLLGRTGAGKSSSGNNILDKKAFLSSASGLSVTRCSQRGTCVRYGKRLEIVDTPGLFDTNMSQESVLKEIVKCVALTSPCPHAFVFVLRLDRYTQEEQECIEQFKNVFGPEMMKYLVILFTRKDDLIHEDKTVEEYLDQSEPILKTLVASCNNRYIAFNNRGTDEERSKDTTSLLQLIEEMVKENGSCYTNEMYEEAEKAMKARAEQIQKEATEKAEHRGREIEEEYLGKLDLLKDTEFEKTSPLLARIQELESQQQEDNKQLRELKRELQELRGYLKEAKEAAANAKYLAERKVNRGMTEEASRLQARDEVALGLVSVMKMLQSVGEILLRELFPVVIGALKEKLQQFIASGFATRF